MKIPQKTLVTSRLSLEVLLVSILVCSLFLHFRVPNSQLAQSLKSADTQTRYNCCGPGCRAKLSGAALHYDVEYFNWQTKLGLEKAQTIDFNKLLGVSKNETVADLGAGGGHILATLKVKRKIAVELNDYARKQIHAVYNGIESVQYIEQLDDNSVDVFYSTSVIEHIECPLTELTELYRKVKPGGRVIIGIKNEGVQYLRSYRTNDTDMHLYTWNSLLLGNLIASAGFTIEKILPEKENARQQGLKWSAEDLATYDAFIYHWAFGRKIVA